MGLLGGATSLVEMIVKKFGDDIEGATQELVRMGGFPEPVARRIATGELPMDEASRLKRAQEQGYGEELYHGSTHDITEFNGQGNPSNDWGQGTYLTDSTYDASTNYAGEGPDLTIRLETTAERIADDLQSNWSHASEFWDHLPGGGGGKLADEIDALAEAGKYDEAAMMAARAITKGGNEGVIYPVRVKQEGLLNVTDEVELPDYNAQAADELGYDYDKYVNEEYDEDVLYEIEERGYDLQAEDYDSPNAAMFGVANDLGADMRHVDSIYEGDTWNDVRNKLGEASVETDEGDYIGAGGILSDVMERTGATGVVDGHAPSRFPTMGAGEHTIIFPGNENQIRSVNAAYDPQYTGSNMMGFADPKLLAGTAAGTAGLLALGASNDADAGFVTRGGRTLLEAWHGSPHKFDKFSMDQIGTGEGAQAYGHGLYFADSEKVARQYRDELSDAPRILSLHDGDRASSIEQIKINIANMEERISELGDAKAYTAIRQREDFVDRLAQDKKILADLEGGKEYGHLYRTEIDVTPESLLDYDTPLQSQPQAVQDAFVNAYRSHMNDGTPDGLLVSELLEGASPQGALNLFDNSKGSQSYRTLADMVGGEDRASVLLNEQGVRGIKFADGNSRKAKQAMIDGKSDGFVGDENYVIFDDGLINIAERGNADPRLLAGTAAGTAGLLAAPALMKDGVFQHGATSEPVVERKKPVRNQSGLLADVTDFGDEVFKSVRHAAGPLADVFMPYEGVNNYLKTVNDYDKQPTWWDRLGILDF